MITRRGLHEEIARLDKEIEQANKDKSEYFKAYREQLAENGFPKDAVKLEIDAFKKAERKLRALAKDAEGEAERDDLVDEIVAELGTPIATRTRASRTSKKPKGQSAEHNARSAPLGAATGAVITAAPVETVDGDLGDGDSAVSTNSNAPAVQQPTPPPRDSNAAAGIAPSVSAAPVSESDSCNPATVGELDGAQSGSPQVRPACIDPVGCHPVSDGDIRGTFLDRSLWV